MKIVNSEITLYHNRYSANSASEIDSYFLPELIKYVASCKYLDLALLILINDCFTAATGVLKGFDPLLNLVLDGTTEYLRGEH